VEDSEPAVIQMTDILTEHGYQVLKARTGREALAQIALAPPDAMILDLMMPEVDGFAVLRSVRGNPATAALPVLILTAKHVTPEELSFLKGNHIRELIQKGDISKAELLAAIGKLVAAPDESHGEGSQRFESHGEGSQPRSNPRHVGEIASGYTPTPPGLGNNRPRNDASATHPLRRDGKPVILVVEDNLDNLKTARAVLGDDYQVIEATDGQAGVAQARAHHPDLILMDISMPVLNGIQALAAIRDDDTLRHTPVIALTASAMMGDRETILAHGFDGYLAKPIEAELLVKTVREILA
jgi:CheY-like chemotaxis protein